MMARETRRSKAPWTAACLGMAAALLGMALLCCSPGGAEGPRTLADKDGVKVETGLPAYEKQAFTFTRAQWLQGELMQASPLHPLPQDYPAPETRSVQAVAGLFLPAAEGVLLRPQVIYALCRMQAERAFTGEAVLSRGAVSFAQQEEARRQAVSRYAAVYPLSQAIARAAAAVPGGRESEHETGWAVDIALTGPQSLREENPLYRNGAGAWIGENMGRFGFIQRYAPGAQAEGHCESIHLRYVGEIHAAAMGALDLGLEDYLALLRREGALNLRRDGQPWACIMCVPEQAAVTLLLPRGAVPEISGDNDGYVIAAAYLPASAAGSRAE